MGVAERTEFTIRDALADFVEHMENELASKDEQHPDGWGEDTPLSLFYQADDRMDRLYLALESSEDNGTVGELAVDVANWMMMIADNVGYLTQRWGS